MKEGREPAAHPGESGPMTAPSPAPALPSRQPRVELWTDGACAGNPGPGGWAALLLTDGGERELSGGAADTTNNRMELQSVIEGLRVLTRYSHVDVHLDSTYVMHAFTEDWLEDWRRNGWKTSGKKPVKNQDLWEQLDVEVGRHDVEWVPVKGHSGVALNDRVDALAVVQRDRYDGR
jgi:ribonuclease HI